MKIPPTHGLASSLHLGPVGGSWYRAIRPRFYSTALSVYHSRTVPGRFNNGSPAAPSFPILYLAEDHMLALFEVQVLLGSPLPGGTVPHPRRSATVFNVAVSLRSVADLTDPGEQAIFDTNVQELTGDWNGYRLRNSSTSVSVPVGVAETQKLGAALHAVPGLEGFLAVSAKLPYQKNLVVFPDKLSQKRDVLHIGEDGQEYELIF